MKTSALFGMLSAIVLFIGAGCAQAPAGNKPVVATTIVPLTSITQNLLQGVADVQTVLPKGAEPHDVILSTRELQVIQEARVVITLGLTLDDWIATGISAAESKAPVIVASKYLNLAPEMQDPHVWLSPKRMIVVMNGIANELQKQFPESSAVITENTIAYRAKLQALDEEFAQLSKMQNRDMVTLHDAFGYLAQDYNLNIVAVVKELPEDNPSPEAIARVIKQLNKYPKAALFGESEVAPQILTSVAKDTGRQIYMLDPLEVADVTADTYITVMRKNLQVLQQALGAKK